MTYGSDRCDSGGGGGVVGVVVVVRCCVRNGRVFGHVGVVVGWVVSAGFVGSGSRILDLSDPAKGASELELFVSLPFYSSVWVCIWWRHGVPIAEGVGSIDLEIVCITCSHYVFNNVVGR